MGTRDIYIALVVTAGFILCFDYLFNEDSMFCCLPDSIIENLKELDDDDAVPEEDAKRHKKSLKNMKIKNVKKRAQRRKINYWRFNSYFYVVIL